MSYLAFVVAAATGKLMASDGADSDRFGIAVALSDDGATCAIGADSDTNSSGTLAGAVYVFSLSGGTWSEQAKLQGSGGDDFAAVGASVSLADDGNTCAVGSPSDDNSGGSGAGSVYIFTRAGTTWTEQTRLQAGDAAADDRFGASTALSSDGNTCAIGASFDDNSGGSNAGSVYIFTRSGTTWTEQARLQASDAAADDRFGESVALSSDGNTCAIGAYLDNNSGGTDAGSVYIFTRSGSTWSQQARLQATDAAASDAFGRSVALSDDGNTCAIGAYLDNNSGGTDAGSVYIFTRSGSTWSQQARLQATDAAASDQLGISVALSSNGNTCAIGAPLDDNSGGSNAGSVYIFTRSGSTWSQQARLQASDASANDNAGSAVALNGLGTKAAIGAPRVNIGANELGAVYIMDTV